jgi:DNA primase
MPTSPSRCFHDGPLPLSPKGGEGLAAMAFPPGFLDELRSRISLSGLVSRRVKLERRGREFAGLCPFHHEKTPSFYVVDDKDFFHCFGCGAHGDAIGFMMRAENLDFLEAVERLAAEAGIAVPQSTPEEQEKARRQKTLLETLEAAAAFYEARLWSPAGQSARDYLKARGLDADTIRRFRLGWASDDRRALRHALSAEYTEPLLVEAGLLHQPEDGEPFDYFRNRVMFPIGDRAGRIIAFGGRVLGDGQPKYLNSPESPVFAKGRVLYGWSAARANAERNADPDTPGVIVTEGYMDVIALHSSGFATAVAPLGTALTEFQLQELWRLAPEPVICLDSDRAGGLAAIRTLNKALPLLQPGHSLRFVVLPPGEDPDSLIRSLGKGAFAERLRKARYLSQFWWDCELMAWPVDTPERRAYLERRLMEGAELIADRAVRAEYRRFFREQLFALGRRAQKAAKGARLKGETAAPGLVLGTPPPPSAAGRRQREALLGLLLKMPSLAADLAERISMVNFPEPELDELRRAILQFEMDYPANDAAAFQQYLDNSGLSKISSQVLSRIPRGAASSTSDPNALQEMRSNIEAAIELFCNDISKEIAAAKANFMDFFNDDDWERLRELKLRENPTGGRA